MQITQSGRLVIKRREEVQHLQEGAGGQEGDFLLWRVENTLTSSQNLLQPEGSSCRRKGSRD